MKLFKETLMETGKLICVDRNYAMLPLFSNDVIKETESILGNNIVQGSSSGEFGTDEETVIILESSYKHRNYFDEYSVSLLRSGYNEKAFSHFSELFPIVEYYK